MSHGHLVTLAKIQENSKFSLNEIKDQHKKFVDLQGGGKFMDIEQFSELCMIMGIRTSHLITNRIFASIDLDKNQRLDFVEYLKFFEIILKGNIEEKNLYIFNILDCDHKGYIDSEDLKDQLVLMNAVKLMSDDPDTDYDVTQDYQWLLSDEELEEIDIFAKWVFDMLHRRDTSTKIMLDKSVTNNDRVYADFFLKRLEEEPLLCDIFDQLSKGLSQGLKFNIYNKYSEIICCLEKIESEVRRFAGVFNKHDNKLKRRGSGMSAMSQLGNSHVNHLFNSVVKEVNVSKKKKSIFSAIPVMKEEPNIRTSQHKKSGERKKHRMKTNFNSLFKNTIEEESQDGDELGANLKHSKNTLSPFNVSRSPRNNFNNNASLRLQPRNLPDENESRLSHSNTNHQNTTDSKDLLNMLKQQTKIIVPKTQNDNYEELYYKEKETNVRLRQELLKKDNQITELKESFQNFFDLFNDICHEYNDKWEKEDATLAEQKLDLIDQETRPTVKNVEASMTDNKIFIQSKNWGLIICIMEGIEISCQISKSHYNKYKSQSDQEYKVRNHYMISHPSLSDYYKCLFIDIAPSVFYDIRKLDGIKDDEYTKSLGPEGLSNILKGDVNTFSGLESFGRSGSFFYYTHDQKFMVKTIKKNEVKLLKEILKDYHNYIKDNPKTYLSKIIGFHKMKLIKKNKDTDKHYIIIMKNIFGDGSFKLEAFYDLKGSERHRDTPYEKIKRGEPGKDINWLNDKRKISIDFYDAASVLLQIKSDANFLKFCKICDYSFLIGIHKKESEVTELMDKQFEDQIDFEGKEINLNENESPDKMDNKLDVKSPIKIKGFNSSVFSSNTSSKNNHSLDNKESIRHTIQLGEQVLQTGHITRGRSKTNSYAKTFLRVIEKSNKQKNDHVVNKKQMYENYLANNMYSFESVDQKYIYTFGIIDILTGFGVEKRLESVYKRNVYGNTVSCQPPDQYADRFYDFMKKQMESEESKFDPNFLKKGNFKGKEHRSPSRGAPLPPKQPASLNIKLSSLDEKEDNYIRKESYGMKEFKAVEKRDSITPKVENTNKDGHFNGINFGLDMGKLSVSRRRSTASREE